MAENEYNRVPLGVANTGEAFVLGPSRAAQEYIRKREFDEVTGLEAQRQAEAAAKAKRDALAKSYKDNAIQAKGGLLFSDELNRYIDSHLKKGVAYAQKGIDIYNPDWSNPEQVAQWQDYQSERNQILEMQDLSKQLTDVFKKGHSNTDPEISEQSREKFGTYFNQTPEKNRLRSIYDNSELPPELEKRYNWVKDFDKNIKPSTMKQGFVKGSTEYDIMGADEPKIRAQVLDAVKSDARAVKQFKDDFGFDPAEVRDLPNDEKGIRAILDRQFRDPGGEAIVAQTGAQSYSDPRYTQLLDAQTAEIMRRKKLYNNFIDERVKSIAAGTNSEYSTKPNFAYEDQAMQRAAHRKAMTEVVEAGGQPVYGQTLPVAKLQKGGQPAKIVQAVSPMSIYLGKTKGEFTPSQVTDSETGTITRNPGAIRMDAVTASLMPVVRFKDKTGKVREMDIGEGDRQKIMDGTFTVEGYKIQPNHLYYRWWANGLQKERVEEEGSDGSIRTVTKEVPKKVPLEDLMGGQLEKGIDIEEYEKTLPIDIRTRLISPTKKQTGVVRKKGAAD